MFVDESEKLEFAKRFIIFHWSVPKYFPHNQLHFLKHSHGF